MEGAWSLAFNALDFEMGRNFYISKKLTFRPHLGLKFSWMTQEYDVSGFDALDITNLSNFIDMKQDQFGVGVRTGLDTAYCFDSKWSIFGDFGISGMYNYFDAHRSGYVDSTLVSRNTEKTQFVTTVVEMDLGLRFATIFSKGKYKYLLQAGWETQVWFDQNQFLYYAQGKGGNLSLSGLTIKTGFWF
jgi:hypothetical protein